MEPRILRIVLPYIVIGALWIVVSDWFVQDPYQGPPWQTIKGLAFVLGTAGLLGVLVHRQFQRQASLSAMHQQTFQLSLDPMCILDLEGRFRQVNPAWQARLGWDSEEMVNQNLEKFVHPGDTEALKEAIRTLVSGRSVAGLESRYLTREGSYRVLSLNAVALPGDALVFGAARDVTAQRALSEQFQRAEKLDSLARLVAGLAHDFKNLLTVIMAHAQLARLDIRAGDPMEATLDHIGEAASEAARLADRLLLFGKPKDANWEPFEVNRMLERLQVLLRPILREDVELSLDLDPTAGWVQAEQSQIEEVVTNLCINARDALPKGGRIEVRTRTCRIQSEDPEPGLIPGEYAVLEVSDNGVGIPPQLTDRIFEPFFTTKPAGRGSGLGLATAYAVVKGAGGEIRVDSVVGLGTQFKVFLPKAEDRKLKPSEPVQPASLPRGAETILFVEDDPSMRAVLARMLGHLGYTVLAAAQSAEALQIAQQQSRPIHLLLTDMIMPGLSGSELAQVLQRDRPELRVLFISGYPLDEIRKTTSLPDGAEFLMKPVSRSELALKIREILDRR